MKVIPETGFYNRQKLEQYMVDFTYIILCGFQYGHLLS